MTPENITFIRWLGYLWLGLMWLDVVLTRLAFGRHSQPFYLTISSGVLLAVLVFTSDRVRRWGRDAK